MKVPLDECVDPAFVTAFTRHEAESVVSARLTGVSNGELLRQAIGRFDAFVTVERGISYQQNLGCYKLVFVLLRVGSNRAEALNPFVNQIESILDIASPGSFHVIESPAR
jgi:hypothetical protein